MITTTGARSRNGRRWSFHVGELPRLLELPSADTSTAVMTTVEAVVGKSVSRERTLSWFGALKI